MTIKDYIYLGIIGVLIIICSVLGYQVNSYKTDYENELQLNAQYELGIKIASDEALKDDNKTQIIVKEIIKRYEPQKKIIKEFKQDANETNTTAANRLINNFTF